MLYEALTAWGTLAAVVVALALGVLPILREHSASKKMARHVRDQVGTVLFQVRAKCWHRLKTTETSFLLDDADRDHLAQLRAVYPLTTILNPIEVDRLGVVYFFMNADYLSPRIERKSVQRLSDAVVEADAVQMKRPVGRKDRRREKSPSTVSD